MNEAKQNADAVNKVSLSCSTLFGTPPMLIISLLAAAVSALLGKPKIALGFTLVLVIGAVCRIWAKLSARKLSLRIDFESSALFPGEKVISRIRLSNDKLLPVPWTELYIPLDSRLSAVPEGSREPDDTETAELREAGFSEKLVLCRKLPGVRYYEEKTEELVWTAVRRGEFRGNGIELRTGDGIGLVQVNRLLPKADVPELLVYPALIPVTAAPLLRNLWNADTGKSGMEEDITVIRSTRGYEPGDPVKHINWRLLARGLPLTVNTYDEILPRSVHFFLDGESFMGEKPHPEELERALSLIGSEALALERLKARCSLSLPLDKRKKKLFVGAENGAEGILSALALYEPQDPVFGEEGHIERGKTVFDTAPLSADAFQAGHYYYVAYSRASLEENEILRLAQVLPFTLILCEDSPGEGGKAEGLRSLSFAALTEEAGT